MADPKPVKVTVAKGRTIQHGVAVKVGELPDGKPIYRTDEKTYGPGEEVELYPADAEAFRAGGFLVDPDAELAPLPQGARVGLVSVEKR